jgi:hypothetical protein
MPSISALSMRILVQSPTLIGLGLPLITLISIARKCKQFLTCTHETTRAKLERLRSARLVYGDQKITTRHVNTLIKTNELISLLATRLSTIKHVNEQVKLINMRRFASNSKHAKVSKQY